MNYLLRNRSGLCILIVVLLYVNIQTLYAQTTTLSQFDKQVESIMQQWKAPGVIISIVKDGQILLVRGYGKTDVKGGNDVTPSTMTSVASVTKTFNSVAFGMLADDSVITWDDPVLKHIPEFEFADPYRTENTTIRDLITHRSGLPALLGGLWSMDYSIEDVLLELPKAEPRIDFRQRVDYSQVGIALLGEIVARTTGMSWPDFVKNRILEPLKMESTYPGTDAFLLSYPDPNDTDNLMGRALRNEGKIEDGEWKGAGRIYTPAGGIVSTGEDMSKFMLFLLNGGIQGEQRLLSQDRIEETHTPQEVEGSPYGLVVNPFTSLVAYCLGWMAHEYEGYKIVEHPGSNFGSSVIALMPKDNIGVFISSNANYSLDSDRMVSALKFAAFDFALGLEGRN